MCPAGIFKSLKAVIWEDFKYSIKKWIFKNLCRGRIIICVSLFSMSACNEQKPRVTGDYNQVTDTLLEWAFYRHCTISLYAQKHKITVDEAEVIVEVETSKMLERLRPKMDRQLGVKD